MSAGSAAVCLYCGDGQLGSPDEPPGVGSAIFCGRCGALMVLAAERVGDEWVPHLHRARTAERDELLALAEVREFRDAFQLDQMEARLAGPSEKKKVKEIGPGPMRIRSGDRLKLEGFGPDHPKSRRDRR